MDKRSLKLIIVGVGGQGILTVSEILGAAAMAEGLPAIMSEVHGMAQRGGVVTTEMKIGDYRSPSIATGEADIILGFEPVETYRILRKAHRGTRIVMSIDPIVPPSVSIGQGKYPDPREIVDAIKSGGLYVNPVKAQELARCAGNSRAANIVMLGALAGTPNFILGKDTLLEALSSRLAGSKRKAGLAALAGLNKKAFELGYSAMC